MKQKINIYKIYTHVKEQQILVQTQECSNFLCFNARHIICILLILFQACYNFLYQLDVWKIFILTRS